MSAYKNCQAQRFQVSKQSTSTGTTLAMKSFRLPTCENVSPDCSKRALFATLGQKWCKSKLPKEKRFSLGRLLEIWPPKVVYPAKRLTDFTTTAY